MDYAPMGLLMAITEARTPANPAPMGLLLALTRPVEVVAPAVVRSVRRARRAVLPYDLYNAHNVSREYDNQRGKRQR